MLLLLFYTQLGYYAQFILLQWQMKEAAREAWIAALPDKAFFRVSLADVNARGKWEEAGRECWYKDHLYDVIRERKVGDTVWLFCMDDDNEEKLIRRNGEVTKANQEHPDKKTGHSLTIAIGDLAFEPISWVVGQGGSVRQPYHSCSTSRLTTHYTDIIIPPPKNSL